jgi:hypothetical protein
MRGRAAAAALARPVHGLAGYDRGGRRRGGGAPRGDLDPAAAPPASSQQPASPDRSDQAISAPTARPMAN